MDVLRISAITDQRVHQRLLPLGPVREPLLGVELDRVDEAAELYLLAVNDPAIPAGIKEKALYQLGLMYLAPDNPHPNRDKAIEYLRRQLLDYPEGELSNKAGRHLDQALNVQPR